jgi:hypothetical protein
MKTYWGSEGIAPRILDLGSRLSWVASFTHQPLYPQGKSSRYPSDRRLGGHQSRSEHGGEENNSQPLSGIEAYNSDRPARSLVATSTELSRLLINDMITPKL